MRVKSVLLSRSPNSAGDPLWGFLATLRLSEKHGPWEKHGERDGRNPDVRMLVLDTNHLRESWQWAVPLAIGLVASTSDVTIVHWFNQDHHL